MRLKKPPNLGGFYLTASLTSLTLFQKHLPLRNGMNTERVLRKEHEGTLVRVWSLPLYYEGLRGSRHIFRMPFSDQIVTEGLEIEQVDGAVELIEDFECVRTQYVQTLAHFYYDNFRKLYEEGRRCYHEFEQAAFEDDLKILRAEDARTAYKEALDRFESECALDK